MSAPGRDPGPGGTRAPAGLDDEADRWLVGRARSGDQGAYEELVRRHRDRIYRIALRMLGSPADADDVAQEVVIQLWTALSGFAGSSAFTTWLYRVVVNRCLNHRRGQRPHDELADADHPRVAGPESRVLAGEELQAGLAAISRLPEDQRVSLVLVQLEGLSYRDAANVTKTSEATVRGRLARARATLMSEMKDWT
ncbi:RNA polymerase sigma factor [Actinomycetospora straminea]|uniref:Sigma-70 family RNA polymerase sigma factor n=1 Tax=Actinomycetospora straminea TaxID=663607 RepID=A0ABP9DZI8_9PSEU|nr:sigma-70 family RNA polymerase sigma factor [Actinomycetospora straminea]MDD7936785.1 sigma-70 family RNA polymerase sigma factor [Actinomycetospora straminea]